MTLEEEIMKQEEKAMTYKSMGNQLSMNMSTEKQIRAMEDYHMSDYHKQLAEWLRELKKYRTIFEKVGKILADNGYTIDDLDTIFGKVNEEVNADEDSD